ncbi:MAG TPA: alpha/beta fold hydrolase [Polyangia bacterium]|nr:alpha/beta fold hydrolase [Polyangia bacterium]
MTRLVFAHGLEGSPEGTKATYLRETLGAIAPWLGESILDDQVRILAETVGNDGPAVVIGSSLGGLAALGLACRRPELVRRLILLAPAVGTAHLIAAHPEVEARRPGLAAEVARFSELTIPEPVPAHIVLGIHDELIRLEDVLALHVRSPSARLSLVHDDHALGRSRALILSLAREEIAANPVI